MRIWENFEKKQLVKGDDFPGQLIHEGLVEDFHIENEKGLIKINFGHGYIELTFQEFIEGIL